MSDDPELGRPSLPLPTTPPERAASINYCRFPKTSEARTALIDKIMRDMAAICTVIDWQNEEAVRNTRTRLEEMSSSKLVFLVLSTNFSGEVPDAVIAANAKRLRLDLGKTFRPTNKSEAEILEQVKKMRLTHDGCRGWENDRQFMFFRNWLREGWIELNLKIKALEVVEFAVGERDKEGNPTLTPIQRDYVLKTLEHFNWTKQGEAAKVNVNNFIASPDDQNREDSKKFEELAQTVRDNQEAARFLEVMERSRMAKAGKLANKASVDESGELKENGKD